MKKIIVENYEEMSRKAALMISSQVILKPDSVLGLATGDTPLGMYRELVNMYNNGEVDFSQVKTFNLDEYCGLGSENVQSYHYYMVNNFFKHVNIKEANINIPDGSAADMDKFCNCYDRKIEQSSGIDIQVLGIGVNGHIGFNEPGINFEARTHVVDLDEKTVQSNSRFFKSTEEVPKKAVSMGIKNIMDSKRIVIIASGKNKADAVYEMINGEISSRVPASILQLHNNVTAIIDREAAGRL